VSYSEELREAIRKLHGADPTHVESVPVKETFRGRPTATKVYAWSHDTGGPKQPRKHVTVLRIPPVVSAAMAVRAAIREEFRDHETEEP
jgi:hypothetical protein